MKLNTIFFSKIQVVRPIRSIRLQRIKLSVRRLTPDSGIELRQESASHTTGK